MLLFLLSWLGAPQVQAAAASPACSSAVGFRVVNFGSLRAGVWYPSSGVESSYAYSDKVSGSVALNGAPASCTGLPLVVFSHGFGGCGTQSVFITEQLARTGYLVAAPDHADATCSVSGTGASQPQVSQAPFTDPGSWSDQTYLNRRVDMEATIDGMLASPLFGSMIDPQRIAGMGHSLGGYTILAMAGAWPSWREPRLKAALALSPYSQPFQVKNTLGNVQIPVQYQGGTLDIGVTPFVAQKNGAYDVTPPSKFFMELRAASHFAWSNFICLSAGTVADCLKTDANAALINSYGFAFLDHYVRGQDAPLLWGTGAGLADYRRQTAASVVNAASLRPGASAPDSIATLYAEGMVPAAIASPDPRHLQTDLGGVQVMLTDAANVSRAASLYYVSPTQINFVVPPGLAPGPATVAVQNGSERPALGSVTIAPAAPGLFFAAAADGRSLAVGQALYASADRQTMAPLVDANGAVPVNVASGDAYLVLYGAGMRAGASSASAAAGGLAVPVLYLVPQPEFAGMDQIAIGPLPRSLAGRDFVSVTVTAAGTPTNSIDFLVR